MQEQWQVPEKIASTTIDSIASELDLPPLIVAIMINRGFTTSAAIKKFLSVDLGQLTTPDKFNDMAKAVQRIETAIAEEQKIMIYGDYDADGVTSISIVHEAFMSLGIDVEYYVPSRFTDGYGPNMDRYHEFVDQGVQLLITVDNGITGVDEVAYAQAHGMDVIITDHHDLPATLPDAYAIVHPRHPQSQCPFGYFSGAGVAFYLAWALLGDLPSDLLDLAAIGTIGDVMPIVADNRIIVAAGLQQLAQDPRLGIVALAQEAKLDLSQITTRDVSFGLVPRLNSLGRVGSARPAVELLTTFDEAAATKIAADVEKINQQRQALVKEVAQAAQATITTQQPAALVVAGTDWAEGVLGIVASRLVDQYHCPTLVLTIDSQTQAAKGSGRSVGKFDLFKALDSYREHFTKFGGHAGAVGLSLPASEIDGLRAHLEKVARDETAAITATAGLKIDYRLAAADQAQLTPALVNDLQRYLGPFGEENPDPVFAFEQFPWQSWQAIGKTQQTLKGRLSPQVEVIGFRHGDLALKLNQRQNQLVIAGTLGLNHWQNQTKVQITFLAAHAVAPTVAPQAVAGAATPTAGQQAITTKAAAKTTAGGSAPVSTSSEAATSNGAGPVAAAQNHEVKAATAAPILLPPGPQATWRWAKQQYRVTDLRRQALQPQLLQQDLTYICFDPHLAQQLQRKDPGLTLITKPQQLATDEPHQGTFFVDLPWSTRQLTAYLDVLSTPAVFLLFYTSQQRRERLKLQVPQLRALLREIYQQPAIPTAQLTQFARHCQLSLPQLHFGIQVFSELNFVKMDKERLAANRQAAKTPLLESATFRRQQALQQSYRQLALGGLNQLEAFLKSSQKR